MNEEDKEEEDELAKDEEVEDTPKGVSKFSTARRLKIEQLTEMYEGIVEAVDDTMRDASLSTEVGLPQIPEGLEGYIIIGSAGDPFLPDDLTDMNDVALGKLFTYIVNYTNYVGWEATRTEETLVIVERQKKVTLSALRIFYRQEMKVPKVDTDDYVTVDERYVALDTKFEKLRAYARFARSRYDLYKRSLNRLSREQTRRSEEYQRTLFSENGRPSTTKGGPTPRFTR